MALRPEIASILTEEIETLVRVHADEDPLPFWVNQNQAITQVCDRIKALVAEEGGSVRAPQGQQPDSGQQMSDSFSKAFWDWRNSSPETFAFVQKFGRNDAGLQNMLFHFFKAGHDHAVKS